MTQVIIGLLIVSVAIFLMGKYSNKSSSTKNTQTGGGSYSPPTDENTSTRIPKQAVK
jgi:large-conductance mechanosensitive channel